MLLGNTFTFVNQKGKFHSHSFLYLLSQRNFELILFIIFILQVCKLLWYGTVLSYLPKQTKGGWSMRVSPHFLLLDFFLKTLLLRKISFKSYSYKYTWIIERQSYYWVGKFSEAELQVCLHSTYKLLSKFFG